MLVDEFQDTNIAQTNSSVCSQACLLRQVPNKISQQCVTMISVYLQTHKWKHQVVGSR